MVGRSDSLRSFRYQLLLSHCGCSTDVSTWYTNCIRPTGNNCSNFGEVTCCRRYLRIGVTLVFETTVVISASISEHCWIYSLREVEYADLPAHSNVFFTGSCSSLFCRSVVNIWRCCSIADSGILLIL